MKLGEGIEILVKDWIDLHEDGGTELSVEEVLNRLGGDLAIKPQMKPSQISSLIESRLRGIPGALESAERFMAQFKTTGDLLEEMDLDCFVSDLGDSEDEDF